MTSVDIRTIKVADGEHHITVTMGGETKKHGTYSSADEAATAAARIAAVCRAQYTQVHMSHDARR